MKYLLVFLILISVKCFAQNVTKKPGIYKSYEAFQNNMPSLPLQGIIKSQEIELGGGFSKKEIFVEYLLKIERSESKAMGKIFGFSDGENFYLGDELQYIYDIAFFKLEDIGNRYYYFESLSSMDYQIERHKNIIHKESGDIEEITVGKVKKILKNEPFLFEKYKDTKGKYDHIRAFLIAYQKRAYPNNR